MAKGPDAFRTISEAADEVGVPQHVLRFWETKFSFIDPLKRTGGRRFYRPADLRVLHAVRRLLHDDGLTIKGVQKIHRQQGLKAILGQELALSAPIAPVAIVEGQAAQATGSGSSVRLRQLLAELEGARGRLEAVLGKSA